LNDFDLVIRGGTVATSTEVREADVAILGERVAAVGPSLGRGQREIDARGKLVLLPGGVDSHCHIEQLSSFGVMCADDFHTATVSAAFGGTTTVMPFCAQHRGDSIPAVLADYHERARTKAIIDYAATRPTPDGSCRAGRCPCSRAARSSLITASSACSAGGAASSRAASPMRPCLRGKKYLK
jgi:hypothetical protein